MIHLSHFTINVQVPSPLALVEQRGVSCIFFFLLQGLGFIKSIKKALFKERDRALVGTSLFIFFSSSVEYFPQEEVGDTGKSASKYGKYEYGHLFSARTVN